MFSDGLPYLEGAHILDALNTYHLPNPLPSWTSGYEAALTKDDDAYYPTILLVLYTDRGYFLFGHYQDCCEDVWFDGVQDGPMLSEIKGLCTSAKKVTSDASSSCDESATWTFYKLTVNGTTYTLRFIGESNGYYSEEIDVCYLPYTDFLPSFQID